MNAKAVTFPAAAFLAVLLLGMMGLASLAQTGGDAVNCSEDGLGTVHETLASHCKGRIVTDEEAAAIRQQRRDYIQKVLSRSNDANDPDRHLASLGSGFFVARDGSVITSRHVVDGCATVSVTPTFGETKIAEAVVLNEQADLALLRTDMVAPGVAPLVPNKGPAVIGPAFIVGYPELGMATIEPIVTAVEILHRESRTAYGPAIVVRGDVRRGNSGGPLLDGGGDVIGVVVAKIDSVSVYNVTGDVVREIGLVLPGDVLLRFLEEHGISHLEAQRRPPQSNARVLEDARPFMVRIGCWR
ncbi:MAG: serine protease [Kiloniellaceae bacterium]